MCLYIGMGMVNFFSDLWMVECIDVICGLVLVLYGEGVIGVVINVVLKKFFVGEICNYLCFGYGFYDNCQLVLDSGGLLIDSFSYWFNLNQQQSYGWIDCGDLCNLGISVVLCWQVSDDLVFIFVYDYGDQELMNDFGILLVGGKYYKCLCEKNYNVCNDVQCYNDQWICLISDWSFFDSVIVSNQLYYIKVCCYWCNVEIYEWDVLCEELLCRDYLCISYEQEQIGDCQIFVFQYVLFGFDSCILVGVEYNCICFCLSNNLFYIDVGGDYIDFWYFVFGYFESCLFYWLYLCSQICIFVLFVENCLQFNECLLLVIGVCCDQNYIDCDDLCVGICSDCSLQGGNWCVGMVFVLILELLLYGQYFISEDGVSNLIIFNVVQQQMDLIYLKQIEVGFKQLFLDGCGEWILVVYYIVKKKLFSVNLLLLYDVQQVGQQSLDGLEVSLELNLVQDWWLLVNVVLVCVEYDDFDEMIDGQIYLCNGNCFRNVLWCIVNFWLDKFFVEILCVGVGLCYVDWCYVDVVNQVSLFGYMVVDVNLGWWVWLDLIFGFELYNLFDCQYVLVDNNNGQ